MGNTHGSKSVKQQLSAVRGRVADRLGTVAATGRYHTDLRLQDEYIVDESKVLGTGMNGSVIVGTRISDNYEVAIKPYTSTRISKEEQRLLRNEVEITLSLDHPHIARLVDVYEELEQLWLVMEICTGGDVIRGLEKRGRYDEQAAATLVFQMLLAVNYMHGRQIVHRDLKLDNFLFEDKACKHIKLIDFGLARYWTNNTTMRAACGTLPYMAPECFEHNYTNKCDMWSLGVCAYMLLSGAFPFDGTEQEVIKKIAAADYNMNARGLANVSENAKDFVKQLLCKNPDERLSAERALEHPWIANRNSADFKQGVVDVNTVRSMQKFANASAFRRVALTMMSYSMSLDDRKKVRQAFLAIDTGNTGTIQMSELVTVLKQHGVSNDEAEKMMATLDANEDNTVYYTEFLAAMMTDNIARNERHVRAAFNRLDRDNSGLITLENLKAALGDTYDGIDVAELLKEVDTHKTGSISYEEFMEYLQGGDAEESHQEAVCMLVEKEKDLSLKGNKSSTDQMVSSSGPSAVCNVTAPDAAPTSPTAATAVAADVSASASDPPAARAEGSVCCSVM
eukprot:TRINITY_DN29933_c0_g1_i1.p1 TRINITY_DN29933_c0_g1~~TRINITY_DN29933_c0_g1_i1.p1  ORF type:complete len:566 (-),score=86.66 TRINITY_DN29933_c0_g1_i1:478-2175(-)